MGLPFRKPRCVALRLFQSSGPMLRMLLLAAVAVVSLVAAQYLRVAVVFTDVKLDDKVAVNYLRYCGHYYLVIAVITCVADVQRAHGDLRDFLSETYRGDHSTACDVLIMSVPNAKQKPAPHEKFFIGDAYSETPSFLNYMDGQLFNSPAVVEIFQIAPTPTEYIVRLSRATTFMISLYHLSVGDCSTQYDWKGDANPRDEHFFVTSIGDEIRRRNPNAVVVFCSNRQSFNPPGSGSYQPYAAMKDLLPEAHLEAYLKEPFLADQLLEAKEVLEYCGASISTPLFPSIPERRVEATRDGLHELILEALKNERNSMGRQLRQYFRTYLEEAIRELKRCMQEGHSRVWQRGGTNLVKLLEQNFLPAFQDDAEMQILMGNSNQVAAVIDAKETDWANLTGMQIVYNVEDMVFELSPAAHVADDKMIYDASPTRCLDLLRSTLLPQ
ncbi:hypothetical protein PBRA_005608 [Plasmodiophora brassicae]|uniref:Uncharacterized protein n=1 Tax=Plasmodiophora brassicae TaxID=37360 RepID=A0A0G4IPB1_PLABS|nr:hypothetical protein PBRA_005608 [Plasmodiophora brassicae]